MKYIILRKINAATNQAAYTCMIGDNENINSLLDDGWSFFITNEGAGYENEAEAWARLSAYKSAQHIMSGRGAKLPTVKPLSLN